MFEDTRESLLIKNGPDVYTSPKITSMQLKLIADRYKSTNRNISSASSAESSPKTIKQISSTKITVLNSNARKVDSPNSKKQLIASKLFETNDTDNTITQREDSIVSPRNNKSVLKPTSGSVGSLIKKKVIFDLEDGKNEMTAIRNNPDGKSQVTNSDWNVSNSPETRDYPLQKEKSMSTGTEL